jgi:hypothetical protein
MDGTLEELLAVRRQYIEILAAAFIKQFGTAAVTDYVLLEQSSDDGLSRTWRFVKKEAS